MIYVDTSVVLVHPRSAHARRRANARRRIGSLRKAARAITEASRQEGGDRFRLPLRHGEYRHRRLEPPQDVLADGTPLARTAAAVISK